MNQIVKTLTAQRTLDYGMAIWVVNQVFDEISEDGVDTFLPDVINENWVTLFDGDDCVGMYRVHQLNSISHQIHAFILPEHRERWAKESGRVILKWCLDNLEFNKLIAEIPDKYINVYKFTKGMGFKDEGINRQSFLKDGKIWDTYRLGQTRKEIKEWLQH